MALGDMSRDVNTFHMKHSRNSARSPVDAIIVATARRKHRCLSRHLLRLFSSDAQRHALRYLALRDTGKYPRADNRRPHVITDQPSVAGVSF